MPRGSRRRPSHPTFTPPVPPPAGACTARASFGHGRVVRPAPSLRCLPTLPLCPREGGPLSAPPFLHPPPLGGRRCVWGGGGLSSSLRCTHVAGTTQARRRHEARHPSLCRGGGGLPCGSRRRPFYPALAPPVVPPPGLARRVPSSGTVVWSVPHPLTAASLPCRVVLGGGSPFAPPPTRIPRPRGGRGGGGGGAPMSSPLRCTHVAGTTQAQHEHGVRHLAAAGGGGGFPLGLPALLRGIGSAPQDHQPLLPLGGSRHVSAWCSVSRACSLLCPYLPEEVRTRVETDDEEVRAAGRTYRTPRRLLAPSAALVEGRAPVSAPNSPGGADCPSSPWCLCIHFRAA